MIPPVRRGAFPLWACLWVACVGPSEPLEPTSPPAVAADAGDAGTISDDGGANDAGVCWAVGGELPAADRACQADEDCTFANGSPSCCRCESGGGFAAANPEAAARLAAEFRERCGPHGGDDCNYAYTCPDEDARFRCIDGLCTVCAASPRPGR